MSEIIEPQTPDVRIRSAEKRMVSAMQENTAIQSTGGHFQVLILNDGSNGDLRLSSTGRWYLVSLVLTYPLTEEGQDIPLEDLLFMPGQLKLTGKLMYTPTHDKEGDRETKESYLRIREYVKNNREKVATEFADLMEKRARELRLPSV